MCRIWQSKNLKKVRTITFLLKDLRIMFGEFENYAYLCTRCET